MVTYSNDEDVLTSVHPELSEEAFAAEVYPNPAKHQMTIATDYEQGKLCVHILNAYGVEVRSFVIDKRATIDISDLQAGMYFVSIIGGQMVTKKVIVE